MRILQINSVCGIRSTGRICTDIANVLKTNNIECQIAYGREEVPKEYENIAKRIGTETDVKFHAFSSRIMDNSGFCSRRVTEKFLKWVVEWNPDVIHLHNIHGYYIDVEQLFSFLKKTKKPVVWTLHDCWPFTGHCTYFDFINCNKWITSCGKCPQKNKYPSSMLLDASSANFKRKKKFFTGVDNLTIVTPSDWLAQLVKKSFLQDYPVEVIHNGIDLNTFRKSEKNIKQQYGLEGKRIILAVADGWGPRKGLEDIIQLSVKLRDDEKIVMVGFSGSEREKIPESIMTISRTNNIQELVDLYSSADVFINPTYEDNYPTVNLEAQACGIPVVTYKTGGSIESVPDDNIVDIGDINALLVKIRCYNNLKVCSRELFDKNIAYNLYLDLYRKIVR